MRRGETSLGKRIAVVYRLLYIIGILLLVQSCEKDDYNLDSDDHWGSAEHPFPVNITDYATYVVKDDGSLWARGRVFSTAAKANAQGYIQLENNVKKLANANWSKRLYVLRKDNTVWRSDLLRSSEIPAFADQRATEYVTDQVKDVVTGTYYAVLLKFDGTVWAIGENTEGAFGIGTTSNNKELPLTKIASGVKQIAVGDNNTFIVKNDNSLWSAGSNIYAKLGYPDNGNQITFKKVMDAVKIIRASGSNTMVVKMDGTAWSFGCNANGEQGIGEGSQEPTLPHEIAQEVQDVFPSVFTCYFLKKDGTLWASGSNSYGQMGMAQPKISLRFIQIAERVTYMSPISYSRHIVLLQDGKFKMAGRNNFQELQQSQVPIVSSFTEFVMP